MQDTCFLTVRWTLKSITRRYWITPTAVPRVTDLSGTSRGALPPPARGTAFELLLAVMFVSKPAAHLMDKHKRMSKM